MVHTRGKTRVFSKEQKVQQNNTEVRGREGRTFHRDFQNVDETGLSRNRFRQACSRRVSGFHGMAGDGRTQVNIKGSRRRNIFNGSAASPDDTGRNYDSPGKTRVPVRGTSEEDSSGNEFGNDSGNTFGNAFGNAGKTGALEGGKAAGDAGEKAAEAGAKTAETGARVGGAAATGGTSEALHAVKAGFNVVKKTADTARKQMEGTGQNGVQTGETPGGAATDGTAVTEMNANSFSAKAAAAIAALAAVIGNAIAMVVIPLIITLLPIIIIVACITAPITAALSIIDLFRADVSIKTEGFRSSIESVAEEYDLQDYTEILLAIMEIESGGDAVTSNNDVMGMFKGTARDAFISANGRDITVEDSMRSAAQKLAQLVAKGKARNVDRKTIIEAYNLGEDFIDYVADNYGGCYSNDAALATRTSERSTGRAICWGSEESSSKQDSCLKRLFGAARKTKGKYYFGWRKCEWQKQQWRSKVR